MTERRFDAHLPQFLPGGKAVIYTALQSAYSGDVSVEVLSLETGQSDVLIEDASDARYVPITGHLVVAKAGSRLAAPFDLERLRLTGGEVGILDSVLQELNGQSSTFRTGTASPSA